VWERIVTRYLLPFLALMAPLPLTAQQVHVPIIPNLIGPNTDGAQVSVVVDRGLTSNRNLRSSMRAARTRMQQGQDVGAEALRALANLGDGLAAQRYVRLLEAQDTAPNPSDLAYYSAIAVGTGRIWTLRTMIEAMHQLDPETEPSARLRTYIKVLYPHAWAGNTLALQAVVEFNGEGRLFGPLSDKTRARIQTEAAKHGDGRIELGIAVGMLERHRAAARPNPKDLAYAQRLLRQSAKSTHLAVATSAQNLLLLIDMTIHEKTTPRNDRTKDD
jgi:hypothetical protein